MKNKYLLALLIALPLCSCGDEHIETSTSEIINQNKIEFILKDVSVEQYETVELKYDVVGELTNFVWSVANPNILEDRGGGIFYALTSGRTTVTISSGDVSDTCSVNVLQSDYSPLIYLEHKELNISDKEDFELPAYLTYKDNIVDSVNLNAKVKKGCPTDLATLTFEKNKFVIHPLKDGKTTYIISATYHDVEVYEQLNLTINNLNLSLDISGEGVLENEDGATIYLVKKDDGRNLVSATPTIKMYDNGVEVDESQIQLSIEDEAIAKLNDKTISANSIGDTYLDISYDGNYFSVPLKVDFAQFDIVDQYLEIYRPSLDLSKIDLDGDVNEIMFDGSDILSSYDKENKTANLNSDAYKVSDNKKGSDNKYKIEIRTEESSYNATAYICDVAVHNKEELDMVNDASLRLGGGNNVWGGYIMLADNIIYNNSIVNETSGDTFSPIALPNDTWYDTSKGFQGTFDGNGHYIDGLKISKNCGAFIATLGVRGTIKNIAFDNAFYYGGDNSVGLLTHAAAGTIENVYVRVTTPLSSENVGPLVARYSEASLKVEKVFVDFSAPTAARFGLGFAHPNFVNANYHNAYVKGSVYAIHTSGNKVIDSQFSNVKASKTYAGLKTQDFSAFDNDFWLINDYGFPIAKSLSTHFFPKEGTNSNISLGKVIEKTSSSIKISAPSLAALSSGIKDYKSDSYVKFSVNEIPNENVKCELFSNGDSSYLEFSNISAQKGDIICIGKGSIFSDHNVSSPVNSYILDSNIYFEVTDDGFNGFDIIDSITVKSNFLVGSNYYIQFDYAGKVEVESSSLVDGSQLDVELNGNKLNVSSCQYYNNADLVGFMVNFGQVNAPSDGDSLIVKAGSKFITNGLTVLIEKDVEFILVNNAYLNKYNFTAKYRWGNEMNIQMDAVTSNGSMMKSTSAFNMDEYIEAKYASLQWRDWDNNIVGVSFIEDVAKAQDKVIFKKGLIVYNSSLRIAYVLDETYEFTYNGSSWECVIL